MKSKKELRQEFKIKRCQLSTEDEESLNHKLLLQFQKIDLTKVSYMHVYLPIQKYHEPDTYPIINYVKEFFPKIILVVSRSNFSDYSMQHYILDHQTIFETNEWGIPEPVSGVEVRPSVIDFILVPLLAFDVDGHRVGYGKGFYDRFFALCTLETQRVGLSFFDPIERIADRNEHDVVLTKAITPNRIYSFSSHGHDTSF
ncbi:MAG: 5-formyltetrahydrofolate cyclo-ligase [Sphingobacterium sp.]